MTSISALADEVRQNDRDRYLCAQFAPLSMRDDLLALYALNLQLAHVVEMVREPMLGDIRFEWWRDLCASKQARSMAGISNPTAAAILGIIKKYDLPDDDIMALVDARQKELRWQQPQTLGDLETHCMDTSGRISVLGAIILGVNNSDIITASQSIGTAWALIGYLRAQHYHRALNKTYLPAELCGPSGIKSENLIPVFETMAGLSKRHLNKAWDLLKGQGNTRPAAAILLQATLAKRYLKRIEKSKFHIENAEVERSNTGDLLALMKNYMFARF